MLKNGKSGYGALRSEIDRPNVGGMEAKEHGTIEKPCYRVENVTKDKLIQGVGPEEDFPERTLK